MMVNEEDLREKTNRKETGWGLISSRLSTSLTPTWKEVTSLVKEVAGNTWEGTTDVQEEHSLQVLVATGGCSFLLTYLARSSTLRTQLTAITT
jgi:hypothetical protein